MKKYIKILALILLAVLSLSSCIGGEKTEFDKLNELSSSLTSNYTLTIKTEAPSSHTLTETYTVTKENGALKVHCKTERINQFVINGDEISAPEGYKTVTEKDLSPEEIMLGLFEVPKFNFSAEALDYSSVQTTYTSLKCNLRLPEKFMNRSIDGENMILEVSYSSSKISSISISYTSKTNEEITITYTFK